MCALMQASTSQAQKQKPELEDWLMGKYYPNMVDGIKSMNDGEHYTVLKEYSTIEKYSYQTGQKTESISLGNLIEGYEYSQDEKKILYYTQWQPIYRRSFFAKYYVYDVDTKESTPIYNDNRQRIATISPNGKMVAFVHDNNILIKDLESGSITNVTTDGEANKIINGAPDWVYEEEFSFNQAYCFSADGKYLAYIKFNEERVKSYTLQFYQPYTKADGQGYYPINYEYKYPKVGEDNSIVSVHVYNIATGETQTANLGTNTDIYIPNIKWIAETNQLAISRVNRLQNHLELLAYDPGKNTTRKFFELKDPKYIEENVAQSVTYINGGESFIITTEKDGYRNIQHYGMDGKLKNNVTQGSSEVIELKGYDAVEKKVYFTAVGGNSTQVAVYSATLDGKKRQLISPASGTNEPEFSSTYKYMINFHSDANTPYYITLINNKGKEIRVLEDNQQLRKLTERLGGTNTEFFAWKNRQGNELNGYMIKPADFDPKKQYPVLVVGYNGPNSNMVNDDFQLNWHHALAAQGYIIACTDTRGTGRKGTEFRKCTYGQLGNLETEDLVDFAKYLGQQSYIDGSRLGIWGWSYGGFMVSSVMTRGNGAYKMGIAIAPVESWEYYDNIYTERYMGLPTDNADGYRNNAPITHANHLQGKLLLIYGSADDNVHPQNSMVFCEALVQANKKFDLMQYTNKNHNIYGGNTSRHLYNKIFDYIKDNL